MLNRGPVDVIVVASGAPQFNGSVFKELGLQAAAGTIRVLDAMILLKNEDGEVWTLDMEDLPEEQRQALGFIETDMCGLFDSEDANTLFEGMVPGSALVALAIEHTWAVALVNTLQEAGVELALNFRVPAPIVEEAFGPVAVKN